MNKPTIEEVKKEWGKKGWYVLRDTKDYLIFFSHKDSCGVHQYDCEIKIFKKCKSYEASMNGGYGLMPYIITFDIHQLLTKTFRALGWEV